MGTTIGSEGRMRPRWIGALAACAFMGLLVVLLMGARPAWADQRYELSAGETTTVTAQAEEELTFSTPAPKSGYLYFEVQATGGEGIISLSVVSDYTEYWSEGYIVYGDPKTLTTAVSLPEGQSVDLHATIDNDPVTFYVRAVAVTPESFEEEPNGQLNATSANALALDTPVTGVANRDEADTDCFTHLAAVDGNYTVSISVVENPTSPSLFGKGLSATVFKGENEQVDDRSVIGGDGWETFQSVYLNSGERLYAKIVSDNVLNEDGVFYQIKVSCTPTASTTKPTESTTSETPTTVTPTTPTTDTPAVASYPKPKKPSLKAVKGKKKSIVVKWKKVAGVSGYQIRYATAKSMKGKKTVTVSKASRVKKTIKKLKSGKRYYVQVRSYKKYSGKTMRSAWSKVKSAKVK